MSQLKALWVEKWRPKTISEYVFQDENQKAQILRWVEEQSIPSMILSGGPGCGKTTLARVLVNDLGVDDFDYMEINASKENGIDTVREKLNNFVSTMPFGKFKVVLLDEADGISPNGQMALRNLIESYSESARIILTANLPHKIIPALHSRCQGFHIDRLDQSEFAERAATVLINEEVEFDLDTLDTFIKASYPDLRKCLNLLQANSIDSKLMVPTMKSSSTMDWRLNAAQLFKAGKINEARKLMCSQASPDEIESIIRWSYDNLELWATTQEGKDEAIIIIKNALVNVSLCADLEILVAAMLCELGQVK
jgi:DNA polymerase III delta prime subunit